MLRFSRYIVICLVLGIISTFLAAQICAAWIPIWNSNFVTEGITAQHGRAWRLAVFERTGAVYVKAQAIWDVALYNHSQFANVNRVFAPASYGSVELLRHPPNPELPFDSRYVVTGRGWPFPAIAGELAISDVDMRSTPRRSSGLAPIGLAGSELVYTDSRIAVDDYDIPLVHPIWTGIALDTGLYAVTWAIILSIGVPVCRMLGRRRVIWRGATAVVLGGGHHSRRGLGMRVVD